MATAFLSYNALNLAETAAVATLGADAWLKTSAGNVATIHAKVRVGEDVHALYYPHELPAIGVQTLGAGTDDKDTMGSFLHSIQLGFDVWCTGVDFSTADTSIKTIMAYLRRCLRLQTFSPAVNALSSELDGFLADGDITVGDCDFEHFPSRTGGWLVHGVTTATLTRIYGE